MEITNEVNHPQNERSRDFLSKILGH